MISEALLALNLFVISVLFVYALRQYVFIFAAAKSKDASNLLPSQPTQTVSVLIPAHNEERVLDQLLSYASKFDYPIDKIEVLVIDDSSTDRTGQIADGWSQKSRQIRVIHRTQGGQGKADALNQGILEAKNDIIIIFDADYTPGPDTIKRIVRWFEDPEVGIVQGNIQVRNKEKNALTKMIHTERSADFLCDFLARDTLKVTNIFGGKAGGFRKCLIEELGSWKQETYCEDTDLTCRALLAGYKVKYDVSIDCGEQAPDTLRVYYKQRYRWVRGHAECALKYSKDFLTSRKLKTWEKIDGLLWLNLNWLPIIISLGMLSGIASLFITPIRLPDFLPISLTIFATGATLGTVYVGLRRNNQLQYFRYAISLMANSYVMCFIVSIKAYIDILTRRRFKWIKTERNLFS